MSEARTLASAGLAVLASNWRAVRCMLAKSGRFPSSQSIIRVGRSSDVDMDSVLSEDLNRYFGREHEVGTVAGNDLVGNAVNVDRAAVVMVTSTP